jgi:uncharacterized membrane-anchored protein
MLPPDHPQRRVLADEMHARPPEAMEAPARVTYAAILVDPEVRDLEFAHVTALCDRYGVAPPAPGASHFATTLGTLRFKWERHGEFSGYLLRVPGLSAQPFSEPASTLLPAGWIAALPGQTIVAAHAKLIRAPDLAADPLALSRYFEGNPVVGAEIGDGAGQAFTDFRLHADGCARFLLLDRVLTPRQAGRMMQRLFEIEAYRMLALLALPIARRQAPRLLEIERALAALTDRIAGDSGNDESLLGQLTRLAAEIESGLAASQFRFSASRAYHELVRTRIAELRERRIPGIQTIDEFMSRRLGPAMATCASTSQRMHDLSERVTQASNLLSTRVDIAREKQNQSLLASMERRGRLQLRLQQTVEGLSVAAITYYVVGLVGYGAKALQAVGLRMQPEIVAGCSIPLVIAAVALALRRARRGIAHASAD